MFYWNGWHALLLVDKSKTWKKIYWTLIFSYKTQGMIDEWNETEETRKILGSYN